MNASCPLRVVLLTISMSFAAAAWAEDAKPIAIGEVKHEGAVDFEKEVLPLLAKNCLACHNAKKAENALGAGNAADNSQGGRFRPGRRGRQERRKPAAEGRLAPGRAVHAAGRQQRRRRRLHQRSARPHQAVDRSGRHRRSLRRAAHPMAAAAAGHEPDLRRGHHPRRPVRRLRPGQPDLRLPRSLRAARHPADRSVAREVGPVREPGSRASRPGAVAGLQPRRRPAGLWRLSPGQAVAPPTRRSQGRPGRWRGRHGYAGHQPRRQMGRHGRSLRRDQAVGRGRGQGSQNPGRPFGRGDQLAVSAG